MIFRCEQTFSTTLYEHLSLHEAQKTPALKKNNNLRICLTKCNTISKNLSFQSRPNSVRLVWWGVRGKEQEAE